MRHHRSTAPARRWAVGVGVIAILALAGCTFTPPTENGAANQPTPVPSMTVKGETQRRTPTPTPPEPPAPPRPSPSPVPSPSEPPAAPAPTPAPTVPAPSPTVSAPAPEPPAPGGELPPVPGPDPEDSSTHNDSVEVASYTGPVGFSYASGDGDSFSFTTATSNGDAVTMQVQGTHDNADGPATWFNQQTAGYATHTDAASDSQPAQLHYAFCGALTFADFGNAGPYTCFGQGSSGIDNNWWMGGPDYSAGDTCYIDASASNSDAASLVVCAHPGSTSSQFSVDDGGTDSNYLSLYNPSVSLPVDPAAVGARVEEHIRTHPELSDSDVATLRSAVAALPGGSGTPTSWAFQCDAFCADPADSDITSGKLWAGVHDTTSYDGVMWNEYLNAYPVNNYSLNATAEREKSTDVADWFTTGVGGGGMIGAGVDAGTATPGELNFAFCGDLVPDTATSGAPTCFGQGSSGLDNNWWAGGADWTLLDSTDPETAAALASSLDLSVVGDLLGEVRILVDPRRAAVLVAFSGDAISGAAVDGAMFLAGVG